MEALRAALLQYPSTFDVAENIRTVTDRNKTKLKDKLLTELCSLSCEFSTCMEKVRVWNLLSFLYFVLGDRQNANKYNSQVLQESPDNVIALANCAWFLLKEKKNVNKCEQTLRRLKSLKGNKLAFIQAKAETAFTYSRFGLKQYHNAISIFSEIAEETEQCKDEKEKKPVQCSSNVENSKKVEVPLEFRCIWTYGYALTLQRLLHVNNVDDQDHADDLRKRFHFVFNLYTQIVEIADESECIRRYKARAYVEAGHLAYGVNRNKFLFPRGMKDVLLPKSPILIPTYRLFEIALEIFPNDVFVLERSGKYFRYVDDLETSITLLNRAVSLKSTSYSYHHLALSYMRILEYSPMKMRHLLETLEKTKVPVLSSGFAFSSSITEEHEQLPVRPTKLTSVNSTMLNPKAKPFTPKTHSPNNENCSEAKHHYSVPINGSSCAYNTFRLYFPKQVHDEKKNSQSFGRSGKGNSVLPGSVMKKDRNKGADASSYQSKTAKTVNYVHKGRPRGQRSSQNITPSPRPSNLSTQKIGYVVKNPLKPKYIDYEKHKDVIETIFSYLDMALKLSSNTDALYDKALLYRQIQQYQKALEILETLMQNNDELCSGVMLANAYEQAAFCIGDMLENQEIEDEQKVHDMMKDRDFYLLSSVEMSCNIVNRHPYLSHIWKSPTTLRYILLSKLNEKRTKETLRDLWYLYKKIDNHLGAIDVLKELQGLAEDDAEKDEIIKEFVEQYFYLQKYEEAVIAICMLSRQDNGILKTEKALYIQVFIEAGLDAFKCKHFEKAILRIRKAFDFFEERPAAEAILMSAPTYEAINRHDLFILSNLEEDEPGRNMMLLLNKIGLSTTYNADSSSILPGTPEIPGMTAVMNVSNAFVIIANFDVDDKRMQHIIDRMETIVESRNEKSLIVVLTNSTTEFSPTSSLAPFRRLTFDIDAISETCLEKVDMFEKVKSLLMALALA